ncbi:MAG TPA: hypothetical protein DDX92_01340 [Flavobacteriales bacterium]|jgi:predicted RND superfamily exporter protein|nr:hypothetical protein [Flavobacteriales bacterium]
MNLREIISGALSGRTPYILILLVLIFFGFSIWGLTFIKFNYEFEDFFPKGDETYDFYQEHRDTFGSDNDFVLVALIDSNGVYRPEFLQDLERLENELNKSPYIISTTSPVSLSYPVIGPFGELIPIPWLHPYDSSRIEKDRERIRLSDELDGSLISTDEKSAIIIAQTVSGISKSKSDSAVASIENIVSRSSFDHYKLAGRIFGQQYYIQKMQSELGFFTSISVFIVVVFLIVGFRSWWGVLIPLAVVAISVSGLVGFLSLAGHPFDLLSVLLPTILFVVGISDAVHLISKYLEELRLGREKMESLINTVYHVGRATFLTSVTTAVGFLSLLTSSIGPVRYFGLFIAIGVVLAFVVTFTLLPALLALLPKPAAAGIQYEQLFWTRQMRNAFKYVVKHPKTILALSGMVVGVSLIGIYRMEVNNYLLEDLSEDDPVNQQYIFFEKHYDGVRPFEAQLAFGEESSLFTASNIRMMEALENALKEKFGINKMNSLVQVYKSINRAINGGKIESYRLPETPTEWSKSHRLVKRLWKTGKLSPLLSDDGQKTRLTARADDLGGKYFNSGSEEFLDEYENLLKEHHASISFTGMGYMIDRNNYLLAGNLMWGLVLAFLVVAALMGVIFKSLRMVLITLIPNIIPLLIVGGFMGLANIDLKVSTSIIFTVAFGIAVDDTIHYISKLKIELDKGRTLIYALKRTGISTGRAIVMTSLILISGFIALIYSDFASTYYIGLLLSLTLIAAVLSDLFLLPVLLLKFYRPTRAYTS